MKIMSPPTTTQFYFSFFNSVHLGRKILQHGAWLVRRRHTIVSNTQAAPVRGRSERSGKGRSRGPVGGTFWSRGRPSGAVCAGADAAALGRACRLRLPCRCRSCFSFPFLSLVFSGWFTWWVNGGGKKGWRGALPSYPSPSPPIGPREAIHLSHRSPRPALCSARSRERGHECEPAPAGPAFTREPPILPRFQPPQSPFDVYFRSPRSAFIPFWAICTSNCTLI